MTEVSNGHSDFIKGGGTYLDHMSDIWLFMRERKQHRVIIMMTIKALFF